MHSFLEQILSSRDPEAILALVFVLPTIALTLLLLLGARMWYSMRIRQWELSLKHTMLERGMSAEEIKAVLEASSSNHSRRIPFPMSAWCGSKREHSC
jgi:hypothetical protein